MPSPARGYNTCMPAEPDLRGHTALVTGGARRLGRSFVEALAAHGAAVAVHHGSSDEAARDLVRRLAEGGRRAAVVQADLAEPEQAAELLERAEASLGEIDLLVNNAAIFEPLGWAETSTAAWQRHLAINLTAPFLISQAFARRRAGRPGAIVNLLDWRALRPGSDHFPYTISKAALASLTRGLAVSLSPAIRVNGLALGAILPPSDAVDPESPPPAGAPIHRWADPSEVTKALLFLLAGPAFMTGEILHLDGGRHLV